MSLGLIVTPLDTRFSRFKVETAEGGAVPMILKCLPNHSWIVEKTTMKFFTKKYVKQLGALIEGKKKE